MNWSVLSLALVAALLGLAMPATAAPPCTCDPMPCWLTLSDGSGSSDCSLLPSSGAPSVPPVPQPNLKDLDPRHWP